MSDETKNKVPSDLRNLPDNFMDGLTFTDEPVDLTEVPPVDGDWESQLVPRSVRWSAGLDARLKAAATERGVTMSELIRQFAELGLAEMESDRTVSLADLRRAIASLSAT